MKEKRRGWGVKELKGWSAGGEGEVEGEGRAHILMVLSPDAVSSSCAKKGREKKVQGLEGCPKAF